MLYNTIEAWNGECKVGNSDGRLTPHCHTKSMNWQACTIHLNRQHLRYVVLGPLGVSIVFSSSRSIYTEKGTSIGETRELLGCD